MDAAVASPQHEKFFTRGWIMILIAFIVAIVTQGFGLYSYGMIKVNITEQLGVSAAAVAAGFSTYTMALAFTSLIVGDVIERFGLRISLLISAVFYSGGFIILSFITELWQVYAAYIVMGIGSAFGGVVPVTGIASNWFTKKRGIATAVIWCGMLPGSIISNFLVANMSALSGWQSATLLLGGISFVVLVAASFFLKWRPQDIGLLPDGVPVVAGSSDAGASEPTKKLTGLTRKQAMLTVAFWLVFFGYGLNGFAEMGLFQNMAAFLVGNGRDLVTVAAFMSFLSFAGVVGRLVTGVVIDKIGPKKAYLIVNIIILIGILTLMLGSANDVLLYVGGFCFGVGLNSGLICFSTVTASTFGTKHYGQIWGAIFMMKGIGDSTGVPLIAGISESPMGWNGAFYLVIGVVILSTALVQFIRNKSYAEEAEPETETELELKGANA